MTTDEAFAGWVVLELMGHRRLVGYLSEQQFAGASFLRLDIPGPADGNTPAATQFYRPESVYCVTPTTEATARRLLGAGVLSASAPVQPWELPPAATADADPPDADADDERYGPEL